jgi:hypothetical protein
MPRQRKLTQKRWILGWGFLGLLVPGVLLLRWILFDHLFGQLELVLWPSSFILFAFGGGALHPNDVLFLAVVYVIALITNALLYAVLGLLSWQVVDLALRRAQRR